VKNSQFTTDPEMLPGWWLAWDRGEYGELARTTMQFKQFAYKNVSTLYENLYRSHIRSAYEQGATNFASARVMALETMAPEMLRAVPGMAVLVGGTWGAQMIAGLVRGDVEIPGVTTDNFDDPMIEPSKQQEAPERFIKLVANAFAFDLFIRGMKAGDYGDKTFMDQQMANFGLWAIPPAARTFVNAVNGITDAGPVAFVQNEIPIIKSYLEPVREDTQLPGEFLGGALIDEPEPLQEAGPMNPGFLPFDPQVENWQGINDSRQGWAVQPQSSFDQNKWNQAQQTQEGMDKIEEEKLRVERLTNR
jgi:hypothetical protein